MESADRPDTMAAYYADVQWMPRPMGHPRPNGTRLHGPLPASSANVSTVELDVVLGRLKAGEAASADDVPPDFCKALRNQPDACEVVLDMCNNCWRHAAVPQNWRHPVVTAIFRKGDESLSDNFRPISLLAVGYKVLASLILGRIAGSGVENRLRDTQFGFRAKRSSTDAVFLM